MKSLTSIFFGLRRAQTLTLKFSDESLGCEMKKSLWKLLPLIFGVILTPSASAEVMGAYVPFVAVDAERGRFHASIKSELDRSSIGHKSLNSPITSEQL